MEFTRSGEATLQLGYYGLPLYLKLWYPDGRQCIFYVLGELPEADAFHPITVSGPRQLDVHVRIADSVKEKVMEQEPWIRASFITAGLPEEKSVSVPLDGREEYIFHAVQAEEVMLSLVTTGGVKTTDWVAQRAHLKPEGSTAIELLVDREPTEIQFVKPDGDPAPGVEFRVYQLPNSTRWVGNGISDSDGKSRTATINDAECVLIADDATRYQLLMDVPVDLHSSSTSPVMVNGGGADTFVEVHCEGKPVYDVLFTLHGQRSDVLFTGFYTGEDGKTSVYELHPRSQAVIQLENAELWAPSRRVPFEVGRNAFRVWRTGQLRVGAIEDLARIVSTEFGESVSRWVESGSAAVESSEGVFLYRVPAGRYSVLRTDGTESTLTVAVGAIVAFEG